VRPEFVTVSWYKVFGYPTGVGCLLVRRDAMARLRRPWFSGGTIWGASVQGGWHKLLATEAAFEDGTVNFLSIPDVTCGIEWVNGIGLGLVSRRMEILTTWLLQSLDGLKHSNGQPMILPYGPPAGAGRGGTVAFNFLAPDGSVVDERVVARDAAAAGISLRTGCFCNPGAGERAFGLARKAVAGTHLRRAAVRRGLLRPDMTGVDAYLRVVGLATGGAVRVSLGVASTLGDVEAFLDFAERTYRDRMPDMSGLVPRVNC
jgi:selenocysteine lyase/cysteine desulfurase